MKDDNDLLNKLIENHQNHYDLKSPAKHHNTVKANTPKYIIVAKGIFPDTIKGRKDAVYCYAFRSSIYKMHDDDDNAHTQAVKTSKIIQKDVIACIPTGRWGASLQAHIDQSLIVKSITIVRSEIDKDIENVIQETEFTNCKIMTYEQLDDKIVFSFNYNTKIDDFTDYTKDGLKKGHAAVTIKKHNEKEKHVSRIWKS